MSQAILRRLAALEKRPAKPKQHDQFAYEQRVFNELEMSRDQFMLKYGSFPNWAYLNMITRSGAPQKQIPPQYSDAKEYYFALIHKKP